ncbi:hypothetical protein, partial [Thiolapillus sp.]
MKKLLWIVIGTFILSQSVIADGITTKRDLNPLQEKIVHYVAANQSLIGLAVTEEEMSALEANPEKYRKRPRIHTCFPHLTLCRLSPEISRHRRNRWTCLMPPKARHSGSHTLRPGNNL